MAVGISMPFIIGSGGFWFAVYDCIPGLLKFIFEPAIPNRDWLGAVAHVVDGSGEVYVAGPNFIESAGVCGVGCPELIV